MAAKERALHFVLSRHFKKNLAPLRLAWSSVGQELELSLRAAGQEQGDTVWFRLLT